MTAGTGESQCGKKPNLWPCGPASVPYVSARHRSPPLPATLILLSASIPWLTVRDSSHPQFLRWDVVPIYRCSVAPHLRKKRPCKCHLLRVVSAPTYYAKVSDDLNNGMGRIIKRSAQTPRTVVSEVWGHVVHKDFLHCLVPDGTTLDERLQWVLAAQRLVPS